MLCFLCLCLEQDKGTNYFATAAFAVLKISSPLLARVLFAAHRTHRTAHRFSAKGQSTPDNLHAAHDVGGALLFEGENVSQARVAFSLVCGQIALSESANFYDGFADGVGRFPLPPR